MRIGLFSRGWWESACSVLGQQAVLFPSACHPSGNAYRADLASHLKVGQEIRAELTRRAVDFHLDNGGGGLAFVPTQRAHDRLELLHETLGVTLVSHLIDPLVTTFQGLDTAVWWQALQSPTWMKAVWDRAQVEESQRFGVPSVIHLAMAAPDRGYDTRPLDPARCRPIVSFVGGQNSTFFSSNVNVPTGHLLAGTLAQAVRDGMPGISFYDTYYDLYGLGEPPQPADDLPQRLQKAARFWNAKLYFNAALCVRNRDRFVLFLKRRLGDKFHLVGRGWDTTHGLPVAPRLETADAYFHHFREAAINLNLVNGNAETGLNMRHFEITAAGGFMLCHAQPELPEHFEPERECAVFHNERDLLEKTEHYLHHPEERVAIALAGQWRTLSQHLYSHRLQRLLGPLRPPTPMQEARPGAASADRMTREPCVEASRSCP